MMRQLYLLISRNKKNVAFAFLEKVVRFLFYAFENKNNDHHTNGEFWLMKKLSLHEVQVIFDVGANVGKWSRQANRIFKNGKIYSFEPMPDVFERLTQNVGDCKAIKTFNFALGRERGTITFNYYRDKNLFSSIYDHHMGGQSEVIVIPTIDGDSFCYDNNISEIDFLKLDVEGSEHLVLKGFQQMLKLKKIKVIQFEYGVLSIESKFLLKDYYAFFNELGYTVGKIYPNHVSFRPYDWTLENFIGPNYIAVKSDEVKLLDSLK